MDKKKIDKLIPDILSKEFFIPQSFINKRPKGNKATEKLLRTKQEEVFQQQLAELRKLSGYSQQSLASEMNTAQSAISRFENGWGNPTLGFVQKYCELIGYRATISFKELPHSKDVI